MKPEALLAHFPQMTPKRFTEAVTIFGSADTLLEASKQDIRDHLHWKDDLCTKFLLWRDTLDSGRIEKILKQEQIEIITQEDQAYPPLLKTVYDPPFCLFVRGTLDLSHAYPLAVVGTRKHTPYGTQITQELVSALATHGLTIVSGLALGIDGIAHQTTLDAGGTTIAVLGGGNNTSHIYPSAHRHLAERILTHGGAIISEYPPGALPSAFTFPRRNRIIAGMSLGTLVIEAAEKSGAMITARYALDHGRDIFAVPHPITSNTGVGPHTLIKEGAHMITSAEDIITILNLNELKTFSENTAIVPDSDAEAALLPHLSRTPVHIDDLIKMSRLTSSEVSSTLTIMEMKGKVRNIGSMQYVVAR